MPTVASRVQLFRSIEYYRDYTREEEVLNTRLRRRLDENVAKEAKETAAGWKASRECARSGCYTSRKRGKKGKIGKRKGKEKGKREGGTKAPEARMCAVRPGEVARHCSARAPSLPAPCHHSRTARAEVLWPNKRVVCTRLLCVRELKCTSRA